MGFRHFVIRLNRSLQSLRIRVNLRRQFFQRIRSEQSSIFQHCFHVTATLCSAILNSAVIRTGDNISLIAGLFKDRRRNIPAGSRFIRKPLTFLIDHQTRCRIPNNRFCRPSFSIGHREHHFRFHLIDSCA